MNPPHHAVVAAPAAPAAGGGGAAANAGRPWCPVSRSAVTRAHLGMAAAAAAFALFVFTIKPASYPQLPDQCWTTAGEIMRLRYQAALLLMLATAQASAAATALAVVQPSPAGRFLGFVNQVLGLVMQCYLMRVVVGFLFATGVFCLEGRPGAVLFIFHAIPAATFLCALTIVWVIGHGQ